MTDGAYQQHRINSSVPGDDRNIFAAAGQAIVDIDWAQSGAKLLITPTISDTNNGAIGFSRSADGHRFFAIYKNTKIRFRLNSNKEWRFSGQYDAITTKGSFEAFYGQLEYEIENAFYHPSSASPPNNMKRSIAGHREITVLAKKNAKGRVNTTHGFSFNIDLLQVGTISGDELASNPKPIWLSVTVDPDIKNPPGEDDGNPGSLMEPFSSAI